MKVVNIVVCGKFCKPVDVTCLPKVVHNPSRFSGAVCEHEGYTFLVFKNETCVLLGTRKRKIAKKCVKSLADLLKVSVLSCSTKKIVMSHKLGFSVDLDRLYERLRRVNNL